jgi:long-chain acyl-CoA synthetase
MSFIEDIFGRLEKSGDAPVLREARDGHVESITSADFLRLVNQARGFLAARDLKPGDRCAVIAPNSIRWAALDLAIAAEGLITVPLYARQAPAELATMMKDSSPSLVIADRSLIPEIRKAWNAAPEIIPLEDVFQKDPAAVPPLFHHADHDPVTIIYTSGTSGEAKGVVLNSGNVDHMLWCTNARLDQLMGRTTHPDSIFHYLPFCFAGSWILLLTALTRSSVLTMSTDLTKLADELKLAAPTYFLNVPTLLERVRTKVEESISKRGFANAIFSRAKSEYMRRQAGRTRRTGALNLWIAKKLLFPAIRKSIGGPNLRALICGSAPLAVETQLFFVMLGIPVLQVYGLTETTAICTMDDPRHFIPGRVGPAIPGIEMRIDESNGEVLVRGPNIFPGYWQRPEASEKALAGGWFHTGDQGESDASGNWRISGRLKNLIILNSGHNIAPEPIEDAIAARLPEAQHIMVVGNQRSFLAAIVTSATNGAANGLKPDRIQSVLDEMNTRSPHYKQIRAFHLVPEPFTIESGLLTANGKLKRDVITARFSAEIEKLYQKRSA